MRVVQVDLIKAEGYPAETHNVVTPDGYILEVHRIPHGVANGNGSKNTAPKTPVLLQHGFECSSAVWVLGGSKKSLGVWNLKYDTILHLFVV